MIIRLFVSLFFILLSCPAAHSQGKTVSSPHGEAEAALVKAYPDADIYFIDNPDGRYAVVSGVPILFTPSEGCPEVEADALLTDPPLCALFGQRYLAGSGARYPEKGFDPGRVRNEALMKALYGDTDKDVKAFCVPVTFFGETLMFNHRHGAAKALRRVAARLQSHTAENPRDFAFILPTAGTQFWRHVEGTTRLSAHSFGTAIDLNVEKGLYWRWIRRDNPLVDAVREKYPQAVVDAFEAEGFIWGGKWDAFDFMHFEYRPELLLYR